MMLSKVLRAPLCPTATTTLLARNFSAFSTTATPSSSSRPRSSFDLPDPKPSMSYQTSLDYSSNKWNPPLSKIVATIGPTSEQLDVLQDVVRCGMRIMRLNFSHATVEEVELRVKNLRACKVSLHMSRLRLCCVFGSSMLFLLNSCICCRSVMVTLSQLSIQSYAGSSQHLDFQQRSHHDLNRRIYRPQKRPRHTP
jgi:hypothetical protein